MVTNVARGDISKAKYNCLQVIDDESQTLCSNCTSSLIILSGILKNYITSVLLKEML